MKNLLTLDTHHFQLLAAWTGKCDYKQGDRELKFTELGPGYGYDAQGIVKGVLKIAVSARPESAHQISFRTHGLQPVASPDILHDAVARVVQRSATGPAELFQVDLPLVPFLDPAQEDGAGSSTTTTAHEQISYPPNPQPAVDRLTAGATSMPYPRDFRRALQQQV